MNGTKTKTVGRVGDFAESSPVRRSARRASRRGFTLIEVLIVIAIILALVALVGVAVIPRQDTAKIDLCKAQVKQMESGLKLFYVDFGRYPTEEEGLAVLWDKEVLDPDADAAKWVGYMNEPLPRDIWGGEWGFRSEEPEYGEAYDLWSNGPDGEEGTDDDVTAWTSTQDEEFGGDLGSDLPTPPSDRP